MESIQNKYFRLIQAVEAERKSEQRFFESLSYNKSRVEKKEAGILISPAVITRSYYTVGENIEIEIERSTTQNTALFRSGKGCLVKSFKTEESCHGTISYDGRNHIRIIIKQDVIEKYQLQYDKSIEVELTYDDRPYAVMVETLHNVIKNKKPLYEEWKKILQSNNETIPLNSNSGTEKIIEFDHLNPEQNMAIHGCIAASDLAVIHGPPGTGKTTTIVHLVSKIHESRTKTLVCAPSNNAVDLLVKKLNEKGVKVLRVGNISRMDDDVTHLSIEEKMRNHAEWKRIKKVRLEANEVNKEASSYKRNYGPEEKRDRKRLLNEARELRKWAKVLEERLEEEIIDQTEVICTTLMGAANPVIKNLIFNQLIIDEASQALEPECWIAMLKSKKVIFVGDHKQLPPTVRSKEAQELELNTTILDQISHKIKDSFLLQCQYRMNDAILAFPNCQFYAGLLYGAPEIKDQRLKDDSQPLVFIDTAGCDFEEKTGPDTKSLSNPGEFFILREHILSIKERLLGHSIGIISPYADQVKHIRQECQEDKDLYGLDIEIDTIDGFQGQEKEIIYISLVRSNNHCLIGFLSDTRRLNVALTRARKKLIIIGDGSTLGAHTIYNSLIEHCEKNSAYKSAWEFMTYE